MAKKARDKHENIANEEEAEQLTPDEQAETAEGTEETDVTEAADQLAEVTQERNELKDQLLRTLAEYDNYKRRSKREKEQLYTESVSDVLKEWLPVIDNLERALEACEQVQSDEGQALADGVKLIYRQVEDTLNKLGVEVIPALGEPFDPELHNAVAQVESENYEEGIVADVLAQGYKRGDRVIRHSVVRVAS